MYKGAGNILKKETWYDIKNEVKAAVLHDINNFKVEMIKLPKLKPDEVTVNVKSCGICGSDLERVYKKGMYSKDLIPGHEFSGIVSRVNKGYEHLLNKRVAVYPLIPCRKCEFCHSGQYNLCKNYNYLGSRTHGGFAEKVNVPKRNLIFLPRDISFDEAACIEPLAVAYHGLSRAGNFASKKILILGLGPIGLLAGSVAKLLGAESVCGIDKNEFKLVTALRMGFDKCVLPTEKNYLKDIELVVDCAGSSKLLNQSVVYLKKKGKILIIANYSDDLVLTPKNVSTLLRGEIDIVTSWNSNILEAPVNDWTSCINLLKEKKIQLAPLITHRFSLKRINEAFDKIYYKKIKAVKTIIYMDHMDQKQTK